MPECRNVTNRRCMAHPWECGHSQLRFTNFTFTASLPMPMYPVVSTAKTGMQHDPAHPPCTASAWSVQTSPQSTQLSWQPERRMTCVCEVIRNHDVHCRKLEPRQNRHDVAPALALIFDHALLAGQGPQVVTKE